MLKHMLCAVAPSEVASIVLNKDGTPKLIYLGKEQISKGEWKMLSDEVKLFENTRLYSILFNTLTEQAKIRMFEKQEKDGDMVFGKAMLYSSDTMKRIMSVFKQYRG